MGAIATKFKKIKEEELRIRKEVKKQTVGYVLAAFGFVVGLAWNDAIKTLIEYSFPLNKDSIFAKLVYAFLITFIAVIATVYFVKSTEKEIEKNN
ncbi:MAG: hypothetical protein HY005_00290 [Candidatus Staskawiczbacteria bacterium]|nr:hypothetical protein [Candidatus Staskawiczbacteria bacterium]MBI3337049.1 hypothetical protein [Candidatus Staskawiczbacteria bacterium]